MQHPYHPLSGIQGVLVDWILPSAHLVLQYETDRKHQRYACCLPVRPLEAAVVTLLTYARFPAQQPTAFSRAQP